MLIVDPATGAMWKMETEFFDETLNRSGASTDPEIRVVDVNEIPESWKARLVKVN